VLRFIRLCGGLDLQRAPSAPRPVLVCRLLPKHPHASVAREGLPRIPPDPVTQARKSRRHPSGRRSASSLRTSRRLIPPEFLLTNGCAAVPRPQVDDLWMRSFNSRSEADHVDDQIATGVQFASCSNLSSDGVFGRDRYNPHRRHSALDYLSPINYERSHYPEESTASTPPST
jgi:hypothetical protein